MRIAAVLRPPLFAVALTALVACTGATATPHAPEPPPTASMAAAYCNPAPIAVPTMPAEIPGYTELDPNTGLHMTGMPLVLDLESYRLSVSGLVDTPLELTYDQLRCLPRVEARPDLVCPGFFVDQANWAGASILDVLRQAGVRSGATRVRLVSADGYGVYVSLADLERLGGFLAYEWEGEPLPALHGFPVRAVLPGQTGGLWVKWVTELEVAGFGSAEPTARP